MLAALAACGDDDGPPVAEPDAGDEVDAEVDGGLPEVAEPVAPAAPAAPSLEPCPAGWTLSAGEPAECLPWPDDAPAACEGPRALLPGGGGCDPIGLPCPESGDWPDDLPANGVLYVRPDGTDGAAGTRDDPFGSVRAALAIAQAGDVVALSVGTWDEAVHVPEGVTLRGACAEGTILAVDTPGQQAVVDVTRGDVVIRDLSITGVMYGLLVHGRLAAVRLESVLIDDTMTHGIALLEGAHLDAEDVVVRGTRSREGFGDLGRGLNLEAGSTAVLTRLAVEANHEVGIFVAEEGSSIELSDSVVRDTLPQDATGVLGRGVEAELLATATLARVVLERNHSAGAFAGDEATLDLSDVRILDTRSAADAEGAGHGLDGYGDAIVTARRIVIRGAADAGIDMSEGSRGTVDDLVLEDVGPRASDGAFGRGLSSQGGSRLEVRRAIVARSHSAGAFAGGEGTELVLTDVAIRDTRPQPSDDGYGRAIDAFDRAQLTVDRLHASDSFDVGVALVETVATLRDVVVERTLPRLADGTIGRGMVLQGGAAVTLERAIVAESTEAGVAVLGEGSHLDATDLLVRDTASAPLGAGRGLAVQQGGTATLARVRLQTSREVGLFVSEVGSVVTGTDVQVLDTLTRECEIELCGDFGAGIGIGSYAGAAVTLESFRVERAALVGLQLARDGVMDLSVGVVRDCPVGANVQTEGFDVARLSDRVIYRDNERNFDAASLPLPL